MKQESFISNENERAQDQDQDRKNGGYSEGYFDENETREGQEKYDLATGNPIKNDADIKSSHEFRVGGDGILRSIKKELKNDPTTKWFLENGYDELGNERIDAKKEKKKAA